MMTRSQFDCSRSYLGGRNPLELIQPIIFSCRDRLDESHAMHSNVGMSTPGSPNFMPVNIICPSHFGQGGRSIAVRLGSNEKSVWGMMLPLALGGTRHYLPPICWLER